MNKKEVLQQLTDMLEVGVDYRLIYSPSRKGWFLEERR